MADLPKRRLGRTDMDATVLGYGAMELRGAPRGRDISEADADRILNSLLDMGVNYIDTSIDYGLSEERIGKAISNRRSEYFLASKCGCPLDPEASRYGRGEHVFTAERVREGVLQSLRRLRTDYLDLVQFHASPTPQQLQEHGGLEALQELQQQGKVRYIGISGTIPNLRDQIGMGVFDVFQIPYSALQLEHEELMAQASQAEAGIVIRGGAARGGPAKESGDAWSTWKAANMDELIGDMDRMEFVLRFTYTNPDLDTTIVGTVNPEHLQQNIHALLKGPLPADLYDEAKRRLSSAG
ncbi:MAG TPA: aldo/keto reductase [Chloroflexota bacterium]|nr:aldo/keto reductase [Chloroflexota bacterium]